MTAIHCALRLLIGELAARQYRHLPGHRLCLRLRLRLRLPAVEPGSRFLSYRLR